MPNHSVLCTKSNEQFGLHKRLHANVDSEMIANSIIDPI
jgi:hypothetical protein